MPAFNAGVVTDQNIADIAAYLAPAPTTPPAGSGSAPAQSPGGDAVHGRQVYSANCAACHGASGQGGFGPSLVGEKTRKDAAAATAWIKNPKAPMPKLYPEPLSEKDVEDVAAYVESL
jgi:mono/diheme cytochrome c family protein